MPTYYRHIGSAFGFKFVNILRSDPLGVLDSRGEWITKFPIIIWSEDARIPESEVRLEIVKRKLQS